MADKPRQGDLFVPEFGRDIRGGNIDFNPDGQHNSHYGDGRHFSYDVDRMGNLRPDSLHGINDGAPKGDPGRKW